MANERMLSYLVTWDMPLEDMTREHKKSMNEAHRSTGYAHWKDNIPKHFRDSAAAIYGYNKRTPEYRRYKQRVYRSTVDLVKTGRTKRETRTTRPTVRATAYKCTVIVKLPIVGGTGKLTDEAAIQRMSRAGLRRLTKLTQKRRQGQITVAKIVEEVRAVSKADVAHLQSVMATEYVKSINTPKPRKRSTSGVR